MIDLFSEIQRLCDLNEQRVEEMRLAGVQYAESKAAYRIGVRESILKERAAGTPVTIIGDLVRGEPDNAERCVKRDTAEAVYKALAEEINVNKLRIRVLDEQLKREWGESLREGSY